MVELPWTEAPGERESLVVSVRAVLARAGAQRPYDELVSVLGLGAATVAVADECLAWWGTYARDAALVRSAELLGLRVRALHPPGAAAGLAHSVEFAQHFRDSYVPLMRRALECEQALLAWRGWSQPAQHRWGVVVGVQGDRLVGYTVGHRGWTELVGPAHQVYVVEELGLAESSRDAPAALYVHTASVARAAWDGELVDIEGVQTGERAYRMWRDVTLRPEAWSLCGESPYHCEAQMTDAVVDARKNLCQWLRRVAGSLAEAQRRTAGEWAEVCERVIERLEPFRFEEVLRTRLAGPGGREELAAAIDDVCRMEADLYAKLGRGQGGAAP